MSRYILGVAAYYHDSSATLLKDGRIVAAAQEERFSRKKHDSAFPKHSIKFVLDFEGIDIDSVEVVAFYEKPFLKFERLLETYHSLAPRGLKSFLTSMPIWMKEKLLLKNTLRKELRKFGQKVPEIVFPEHHLSHAASAYYPSGYEDAAILTIDAVGEWATTTIGEGSKNRIKILRQLNFPHSLGLL
jgi:carbamoyltransferase